MRLVADALDEREALRRARQQDRIRPRGHEQLLALLCERGDRYTQQSRVGERGLPGGELALAAVEDHEVRDRPAVAVVDRPLEPPAQRVAHVGEVVVAVADLRAEPAVRVLRRAPVLENDHRAHHARALHVAHVVALDPLRRAVEPERLRELAERGVGLATVGEPTDPLLPSRTRNTWTTASPSETAAARTSKSSPLYACTSWRSRVRSIAASRSRSVAARSNASASEACCISLRVSRASVS